MSRMCHPQNHWVDRFVGGWSLLGAWLARCGHTTWLVVAPEMWRAGSKGRSQTSGERVQRRTGVCPDTRSGVPHVFDEKLRPCEAMSGTRLREAPRLEYLVHNCVDLESIADTRLVGTRSVRHRSSSREGCSHIFLRLVAIVRCLWMRVVLLLVRASIAHGICAASTCLGSPRQCPEVGQYLCVFGPKYVTVRKQAGAPLGCLMISQPG